MRSSHVENHEVRLERRKDFLPEFRTVSNDEHDERFRVLHDDSIFDTPDDDAFGRVVRLAASVYRVPVAFIALSDEERIWCPADNISDSDATALRALCLCSQIAAPAKLFWAEDARRHPLLIDHPLVTSEFGIRFFAAAPLLAPGGRVLGMLCLIDRYPRKLDGAQEENLLLLAGLAADELELRREAGRRIQAHMQFNEERYRELFELNPQPMWVYDAETLRFLAVNAMAVRQYGYSQEEFLSMSLPDIRPLEELPALRASLAQHKSEPVRELWRHQRKDGSIIEVETSSSDLFMARRPARLVVACDVTDRSESRQAIQSRDRYLAALVQVQRELLKPGAALNGLELILARLGKVSGSGRVYYLEHEPSAPGEKLRADWCAPHVLPASEDPAWHGLIDSLRPADVEQLHRGETLLLRADDETLPAAMRALLEPAGVCSVLLAPLLAGGRFHGVLGFDNCVSNRLPWTQSEADHLQAAAAALALALEREATARALSDEKERLLVTLASVTEGVITTDLYGNVVLMNRVAEELTGHLSGDSLGRPIGDVFSVEEDSSGPAGARPALAPDTIALVLATGRTVEHDHQVWLWSRDGSRRRIAKSSAPVYDECGEVIGAVRVFRDITDQEKMTEELLKASKLESIGILAGGIAHDFNNILTAVMGNLSLARMQCGPTPKALVKLDAAERACFRARDLTAQLLTFARGGEPVKKLTRLDEVTRESIHFALHGSTVHAHFALAPDLWPVNADIGQIGQVINNLGINAVQAMPRGGLIEVLAENITVDEGGDSPLGLAAGNYVKICVEDDGNGIAPEHLVKIFDPFFTTKESGSGLGLATSYSIIKKHGGQLTVDSVRGVGSIFRIYLPAYPKQSAVATEGENGGEGSTFVFPPTRSLRVLIMDDEAPVRELVQSMLTHLGHHTVGTQDGTRALEAYRAAREEGRPFDLVILDLTVPGGMGGRDTLDHLRRIEPTVKAVVSSGYSNNPIMSNFCDHGFRGVLSKPYRVKELFTMLDSIFETPIAS